MSKVLVLEFAGVDAAHYSEANKVLNFFPQTGEGDAPAGLQAHIAGAGEGGAFTVVEVWESLEAHEEFMATRLGPALAQAGIGAPTSVKWYDALSAYSV